MTFKKNWEKTDSNFQLLPQTIAAMVGQKFPNQNILSYEVISGGCANLNLKIVLESDPHAYIVRVYLRDKDASYREQKIAALLKDEIPIPEIMFVGDQIENQTSYRFAIAQFKDGISLRDLLLNSPENVWQDVMEDVGAMLSRFQHITFPKAGFLNANLEVSSPFQPDDLTHFVAECLQNSQVRTLLKENTLQKIEQIFKTLHTHLHEDSMSTLVHGDFDPANILVHQVNSKWRISAILDWEFSFSGSWLWDVSNMLRYAHQMPQSYEKSFLRGLARGGLTLPKEWRTIIMLFNISSLLDLLIRHPHDKCPILHTDSCELIEYMVKKIEKVTHATNKFTPLIVRGLYGSTLQPIRGDGN